MTKEKYLEDSPAIDGAKLWDEILKAIVSAMPSQLFPLFKEVYGREYPKSTKITVLGSETTSFLENSTRPPSSTLMDIVLLVNSTDYYHLECQMKNDKEMVIRMFAYDVRFAITHTKDMDGNTGEITLYFPHSVVIYPERNNAIPEHLQCRVVFQDNSEHIYKIPTVRVQTYSLEEIRRKHLTLFIPYTVLRLRPKLRPNIGQKLTEKELTEFVEEVILVLKKELSDGYLTEREFHDYVDLFRMAADRVLAKHPQMREEVDHMVGPIIKLPSMIEDELREKLIVEYDTKYRAKYEAEYAESKAEIEEQKVEIEEQKVEIEEQKAEIEEQKVEIEEQKAELAEKDAEIQRLQELVSQLTAGKPVS